MYMYVHYMKYIHMYVHYMKYIHMYVHYMKYIHMYVRCQYELRVGCSTQAKYMYILQSHAESKVEVVDERRVVLVDERGVGLATPSSPPGSALDLTTHTYMYTYHIWICSEKPSIMRLCLRR